MLTASPLVKKDLLPKRHQCSNPLHLICPPNMQFTTSPLINASLRGQYTKESFNGHYLDFIRCGNFLRGGEILIYKGSICQNNNLFTFNYSFFERKILIGRAIKTDANIGYCVGCVANVTCLDRIITRRDI